MPLIRKTLQKCLLQVVFLSYWKQISGENDSYTSDLYGSSPSLLRLLSDTMVKLSTKDVGIFFSTLRKATALLSVFIVQHPTPSQLTSYCRALDSAIQDVCPHPAVCTSSSVEIASLLLTEMARHFLADPEAEERVNMLQSINSVAKIMQAQRVMVDVNHEVFALIMRVYGPLARQQLSFRRFFDISCSFRHANFTHRKMLRLTLELYDEVVVLDDEQFRPAGERVSVAMFCETARAVTQDATCLVCMCGIGENETGEEKPVVTKCGHVFHQVCLDTWVNESCVTASNTCPACRAEMCEARDREIIPPDE